MAICWKFRWTTASLDHASSGWTSCLMASGSSAQAVFGYLHRNHEKIARTQPTGSMPYTDRLDILLADQTGPTRYRGELAACKRLSARYIRVITPS